MNAPERPRPVPDLARRIMLAIDLHSQDRKAEALRLLSDAADGLAAPPFRPVDAFAAVALAALLRRDGLPAWRPDVVRLADDCAYLARALEAALEEGQP
jgi:hypothetical protein